MRMMKNKNKDNKENNKDKKENKDKERTTPGIPT
jgi:hypothetical protein